MTGDTPENVTLREITEDTLNSILELEVAEEQKSFVKPNVKSIAQAHFNAHSWMRAIYANETPVGFVLLYLDQEGPEYWVWRFMIDKNHQGKDHGFAAMRLIIDHVKALPNARELLLSYERGKGDPSGFYTKLGFVETGEMAEDQHVMKLTF